MNLAIWTALLCVAAFLVGGIPFGLLIGRIHRIDVRVAGSGNIGAANVSRLLGRKWGIIVFLLDAAKGFVPAWIGGGILLFSPALTLADSASLAIGRLAIGLAAVLGHNYCPYLGFRGGKGVATSLGVCLGIFPQLTVPAFIAFAVWAVAFRTTRISSVGSLSAAVAFPVLVGLGMRFSNRTIRSDWPFLVFATLIALLIILRHRANILRLLSGSETRFARSPSAPASVTRAKQ